MRQIAPSLALALVAALALGACDRKQRADIDIPTAKTRAALALSAFECSTLAGSKADASRLFNVGMQAGRDFLDFADKNPPGYQSISNQVDPVWLQDAPGPSVDFRLGALHARTLARADAWRNRYDERNWEARRQQLYAEKNCQFLSVPAGKK